MWYQVALFLFYSLHSSNSSVLRDKRSTPSLPDYETIVCDFKNNETLMDFFYADVRQRYNVTTDNYDERYYSLTVDGNGAIPCYAWCCPSDNDTIVTWCVHVYNPVFDVNICLANYGLVNQTEAAKELNMEETLYFIKNCSCLGVTATPYYLQNAYVVRVVPDENPLFVRILVQVGGDYLKILSLTDTQNAILGVSSVLTCNVLFGATLIGEVTWARNGSRYTPIQEDPFCKDQNCSSDDTYGAPELRRNRARVYKFKWSEGSCSPWSTWTSYLIIDNVTWSDAGAYNCEAWILNTNSTVQRIEIELQISKSFINESAPTTPILGTNEYTQTSVASGDNVLNVTIPLCVGFITLIVVILLVLVVYRAIRRKKREAYNSTIRAQNPFQSESQDKWEFPRERLHIFQNRILGKGAFGKVMQAQAVGIVQDHPEKDIVAVKTVKDNAPPAESSNLLDELELMKNIKPHSNVINLLGCCTAPGGPVCLIIEYAMHGNLKSFLRSCEEAAMTLNHKPLFLRKPSYTSSCSSISSSQQLLSAMTPNSNQVFSFPNDSQVRYIAHPPPLVNQDSEKGLDCISEDQRVAHPEGISAQLTTPLTHNYLNCKGLVYMEDIQTFALQIAAGLQHLESMEIVHCDLAARNILISDGFVLKISDFGMARDISCKSYYRKCPKGAVPVKWTAPEALEEHLYSLKSDIWSFGIVLWEIFSYGHSPYPDMDIHSWEPFIQSLKNGNRPARPDGCPAFFYNIMLQCWELNPDDRPSSCGLAQAFSTKQSDNDLNEYTEMTGCPSLLTMEKVNML